MVASMLCVSCRPDPLFSVEPIHCFGSGDRPAPLGMLGGFQCSCSCGWPEQFSSGESGPHNSGGTTPDFPVSDAGGEGSSSPAARVGSEGS